MKPDCALPSFRPPYAVTMWADTRNVYVELPAKLPSDPPLIMTYTLTEGGLTKALALMGHRFAEHSPNGGYYPVPLPKLSAKPGSPTYTQEQRAGAREALIKAGLIKG